MDVIDVIRTRRSIRRFRPGEIPDEDIVKILDAARWAPSGGNRQPLSYIYVKDPQVLRMVKNCSPGFYGDAYSAIVIGTQKPGFIEFLDAGFAAENILLAAHSLGIGSCAIASFNREAIRKILNAPEDWEPILLVSLGYPDRVPSPPARKPLSEVVYLNSFGNRWKRLEVVEVG
ncbi:MAG: nitroreductase family protein [Candidatus Bathyarchaeia archaeon]|nr:nitroreductase family protein [Candidatus Bathyarchaeota archaeon]